MLHETCAGRARITKAILQKCKPCHRAPSPVTAPAPACMSPAMHTPAAGPAHVQRAQSCVHPMFPIYCRSLTWASSGPTKFWKRCGRTLPSILAPPTPTRKRTRASTPRRRASGSGCAWWLQGGTALWRGCCRCARLHNNQLGARSRSQSYVPRLRCERATRNRLYPPRSQHEVAASHIVSA